MDASDDVLADVFLGDAAVGASWGDAALEEEQRGVEAQSRRLKDPVAGSSLHAAGSQRTPAGAPPSGVTTDGKTASAAATGRGDDAGERRMLKRRLSSQGTGHGAAASYYPAPEARDYEGGKGATNKRRRRDSDDGGGADMAVLSPAERAGAGAWRGGASSTQRRRAPCPTVGAPRVGAATPLPGDALLDPTVLPPLSSPEGWRALEALPPAELASVICRGLGEANRTSVELTVDAMGAAGAVGLLQRTLQAEVRARVWWDGLPGCRACVPARCCP
jgi:hypothetical protein